MPRDLPPHRQHRVLRYLSPKKIALDHPDEAVGGTLLAEALGTADVDFANGIINQLDRVCGRELNDINFLLAVIKGMKPTDQTEAMLMAQMGIVHMAMMRFARLLQNVEYLQQQDSAERAFNKLARTFTTQMEALKRYRTGGEQKVTVQHVSVREGGQAIVGNVTQAESKLTAEKPASPRPALPDARQTAMDDDRQRGA